LQLEYATASGGILRSLPQIILYYARHTLKTPPQLNNTYTIKQYKRVPRKIWHMVKKFPKSNKAIEPLPTLALRGTHAFVVKTTKIGQQLFRPFQLARMHSEQAGRAYDYSHKK